MGRQGRPSPSPGGAELGGGADDGMVMHWGGCCPTVTGLRAEAVLQQRGS